MKFRPLEAPESYLPFSYFSERCPSKGCFLSMCFAGVVLYRICLDSWIPRSQIIRLKRCRVIQNQGFANLGKVWKSDPPDTHCDVILETFGRQSLTFLCFIGCLFFIRFFSESGTSRRRRRRSLGAPRNYYFKRFFFYF